jgi:hypothetical protein
MARKFGELRAKMSPAARARVDAKVQQAMDENVMGENPVDGVPDEENPEWTPEEIRTAKPFAEVFPDLAAKAETVFESGCELVEVTSTHRPDTSWRFVDAQGHEHRWYAKGAPAESYSPSGRYEVPTLVWVKDDVGYFEDGEPYDIGHHECVQCGEHVEPRSTADSVQQFVPGLRWYRINGRSVTKDEFERRRAKARWPDAFPRG